MKLSEHIYIYIYTYICICIYLKNVGFIEAREISVGKKKSV